MDEHTFEDTVNQLSVLEWINQNKDNTALLKPVRLAADKAIKAANGSVTVKKYNYTEFSMRVATDLLASIKNNYPLTPQPNLEQWAHDIECIVRIDKYDRRVVEGAMRFSQFDEFWRQQIQSGANLRKHMVKVCVKAKEYQQKQLGQQVYKV